MSELRKVTLLLPADLVEEAQNATGKGVTETIRQALKAIVHSDWSSRFLALEGRAPLKIDLDQLRDDGEGPERTVSSRNAAA